jgi:hypothetical protein
MMWSACKIRRKHAIELDEEPSVGLAQPNSAAALPLPDNHLLTEHRNLGVKARLRCERPDQDCENEPEKPIILSAYAIRSAPQQNEVFGTHTSWMSFRIAKSSHAWSDQSIQTA